MTKQKENKHDVFYGHGVSDNGKHRFTIAIIPIDSKTAKIGLAVCGKRDNFNKKIGREVARGRAEKRPFIVYNVDTATLDGMLEIKDSYKKKFAADINAAKISLYHARTKK